MKTFIAILLLIGLAFSSVDVNFYESNGECKSGSSDAISLTLSAKSCTPFVACSTTSSLNAPPQAENCTAVRNCFKALTPAQRVGDLGLQCLYETTGCTSGTKTYGYIIEEVSYFGNDAVKVTYYDSGSCATDTHTTYHSQGYCNDAAIFGNDCMESPASSLSNVLSVLM